MPIGDSRAIFGRSALAMMARISIDPLHRRINLMMRSEKAYATLASMAVLVSRR
jgi:hypothetical protein